jgi:nucleoporin GLE1
MTRSSPARRSQLPSSPDRAFLSKFLSDDRNNEDSHLDALAAAQVQHDRVREAAIRVYELHELEEKRKRILEEQKKEEERLKAEAESAAEAHRLNELRAKSVPKPAPIPEPQPLPEKKPQTKPETKLEAPKVEPAKSEPAKQPVPESRSSPASNALPPTQTNGSLFNVKPAETKSPASVEQAPTSTAVTAAKSNGVPPAAPPKSQEAKPVQTDSPRKALADRYTQIHQELKKLRKHLTDEAKRPESPLKGKLGQARRDIRMAIGQLTGSKGANSQPVRSICPFSRNNNIC